jgi:ubiquinone biosynthesis accessory factor UbiJ
MLHTTSGPLQGLAAFALDRMTLVANHVLAAEPEALRRLQPHAGSLVDASGLLPALMPLSAIPGAAAAMVLRCRITPAGLLEQVAADTEAVEHASMGLSTQSLTHVLQAFNEGALGRVLEVQASNDSLAEALTWVATHVRWDYAGDIERVLPASVGAPVARAAQSAAAGAARGLQVLSGWLARTPGSR